MQAKSTFFSFDTIIISIGQASSSKMIHDMPYKSDQVKKSLLNQWKGSKANL